MERFAGLNINPYPESALNKKGTLYSGCSSISEPERCLECATVCLNCADVCPNRANIVVPVDSRPQIIHVDDLCNECGNCETFCPYSSAPYKDKLTLFTCAEDFERSNNPGFLAFADGTARVRIDGNTTDHSDGQRLPEGVWRLISAAMRIMPAKGMQ
jgi:putative selenate reductase